MHPSRILAPLALLALVFGPGCLGGGGGDDDGGSSGTGEDWQLVITGSICGAPEMELYNDTVQIDSSEQGVEEGLTDAGYQCDNLVVDNGVVDIDCSYTTDYEAEPGCELTLHLKGNGTYSDTEFSYTYTVTYTCGASCSFLCTAIENCVDEITVTGTKL